MAIATPGWEVELKKAAKEKIRQTPSCNPNIMSVWLEGFLSAINKNDTKSYLRGCEIIKELF